MAPDEVEKGVVRVKDFRKKDRETGKVIQIDVPLDRLETVDVLGRRRFEVWRRNVGGDD